MGAAKAGGLVDVLDINAHDDGHVTRAAIPRRKATVAHKNSQIHVCVFLVIEHGQLALRVRGAACERLGAHDDLAVVLAWDIENGCCWLAGSTAHTVRFSGSMRAPWPSRSATPGLAFSMTVLLLPRRTTAAHRRLNRDHVRRDAQGGGFVVRTGDDEAYCSVVSKSSAET